MQAKGKTPNAGIAPRIGEEPVVHCDEENIYPLEGERERSHATKSIRIGYEPQAVITMSPCASAAALEERQSGDFSACAVYDHFEVRTGGRTDSGTDKT